MQTRIADSRDRINLDTDFANKTFFFEHEYIKLMTRKRAGLMILQPSKTPFRHECMVHFRYVAKCYKIVLLIIFVAI